MTEAHPSVPTPYLHAGLQDLRQWEQSRSASTTSSSSSATTATGGERGGVHHAPTIHIHRAAPRRRTSGVQVQGGPLGEETKTKASPALKAVAGSVGGLVEALTLQPMDTIKTRMQLNPALYPGMVASGRRIIAEESIPALWKGLTPFATHLFIKYALRFGTNAELQSMLKDKETGHLSTAGRLLAGLGAGVIEGIVVVTPMDVVKIRLQHQHGLDKSKLQYHGALDAARQIVRAEGVGALWSGVTPTIMRNGIQQATMFYSKHVIDRHLWGEKEEEGGGGLKKKQKKLAVWQSMTSGLLASIPGLCLTNPLDILKTKWALQAAKCSTKGTVLKHPSIPVALYEIVQKDGVGRLYRGLLPRLLRVPPGMAITWAVSDQLVQWVEGGGGGR